MCGQVPKILKLELTNACGLNCVFCGHAEQVRPVQSMAAVNAMGIMAEARDWGLVEVQPQFYGEPWLYRNLNEIVMYAHSLDFNVQYYTSAQCPPPEPFVYPDRLVFSVDYHTQELADKIRPGIEFGAVFRRITDLNGLPHPGCEIVIRCTECEENRGEIADIEDFWGPYCDNFVVVPETPVYRHFKTETPNADYDCRLPREQVVVLSDYRVTLCCNDWHGKYAAGDAREGLQKAYSHARLEGYRYAVYQKQWLNLCNKCGLRIRK